MCPFPSQYADRAALSVKTSEDLLRESLRFAEELYRKEGSRWLADPTFQKLRQALEEGLAESARVYRLTRAALLCKACAQENRSCCRRGMELEVSQELLFLNILLGIKLPSRRRYPEGCFFLGETGCLLRAKPILCRNFFCPWFRENLPQEEWLRLQEGQTREIESLFRILDFIRARLLHD